MGFAPIHELAEKETLKEEFLVFPGDESLILSFCLDPSESFAFVAKASKKLYAIDLAVDERNKRPFLSKLVLLEQNIIELVSTRDFGLWALLENGKIKNFTCPQLQEGKLELKINDPIGCISQIKENVMALGSKDSAIIHLIYFDSVIEMEEIQVPFEELECGSIGISSICLLPNGNSLIFSCKPEDPESDDVPLLLLENILDDGGLKFSYYFDPCASRPPRENQFYYLNAGKWSDNLVDFVVLGNYASPDIGICGRFSPSGGFETYFIDNDEGLAQLPFINGEVTFPVGMALDFSSKTPLKNLSDPDGKDFPPAPILWVLTNSGHLCPFSMLKTDLDGPLSFMRTVPVVSFAESSEFEATPTSVSTAPTAPAIAAASVSASTPQTPSKVPLQQLASLQKSTEIKPLALAIAQESPIFKSAAPVKKSEPPVKPAAVFVQEPEPVLIKKEEKMESMSVGPYQSILLTEIASTHAAMQDDIFTLKQLSLKNSLLLRQNSQKYFNSLESLENYAGSLEKLLKSSENVFASVKDKVEILKFSLNELMGKSKQVKSNWNRIKQDRKINWDSRVQTLTAISEELFQRIDRLRNFLSNPLEAAKYRATLKSFVDSTQEKVQLLMVQLSGLFVVSSQSEDISGFYADLEALDLNSGVAAASCDDLLGRLNVLSLSGSGESASSSEKRYKSLLNAVRSRGSRLLIPSRISSVTAATSSTTEKALRLSAEDESLISSFVSAIKLTEDVPEFAEIAIMAKLSLNEESAPVTDAKSAFISIEAPKPAAVSSSVSSAFAFSSEPAKSSAFSFNPAPSAPKPTEIPAAAVFTPLKAVESKPVEAKVLEAVKPVPIDATKTVESKPVETKPQQPSFEFKIASTPSPFNYSSPSSSPSFSFAPALNEPKISSFGFKQAAAAESESKPEIIPASTTKIPSIFTVTPSTATATKEEAAPLSTEPVSVLQKESPLPTFDSLDFGGGRPAASVCSLTDDIKPFPSIFGVKPVVRAAAVLAEEVKTPEIKELEETKAPAAEVKVAEVKVEEVAASPSGFSFSFKPPPSEPIKPASESTAQTSQPTQSTQPTVPQQPQQFSFSFAPNANNPPTTPSAGFSITTKPSFPSATTVPTFGITSVPTFGATSVPTVQSSALAPAFGQTSLPSAGGFGAFSSNNTGGFAAFAVSSSSATNNASAFANNNPASDNGTTGGTLTFASFLPADKKPQDPPPPTQAPATKPSSTFSFTGFRE